MFTLLGGAKVAPYLTEGKTMSKMSQIDAARQEAGYSVREVSDWFDKNKTLDREILLMVATDPQLLHYALNNQRGVVPRPKPAREHVALQQRRPRKPKHEWDMSMTHREGVVVFSVFGTVSVVALVATIFLAVTL